LQVQANADAVVRYSQFLENETGLAINTTAGVDVDSSCVFNSNQVGIYCYGTPSTLTIHNNTINSNTGNGIRCESSSDPLIQSNVLRYNALAIYCTNSSDPTIKSNMIKSNSYGVSAALGVCCSSGNNTIAYSYYKHVVNWNEFEISAENNCWNVNTGDCYPPSNKLVGPVDTDDPICCSTSSGAGEVVPDPEPTKKPVVTDLVAIVPNPFNPTTTIYYSLASQGNVKISVYDVAGRFVRELVNRTQSAGAFNVTWNGTGERGTPVSSGVYFVKMTAGATTRTMKMVLLK